MSSPSSESWRIILFTDMPVFASWYKAFFAERGHRLVAVVTSSKRDFPYLGTRLEIAVPGRVDSRWRGGCPRWWEGAMELTEPVKGLLQAAARALRGSERRRFLARTVEQLGPGGQRCAERELGWSRVTIRKGQRELASGFACVDAFALRGRKRAEAHLPTLLADLEAIVSGQSQADPTLRTTRLYTRLTAAEVRRQRIAQRGYTDADLPCVQTIGAKLNALG